MDHVFICYYFSGFRTIIAVDLQKNAEEMKCLRLVLNRYDTNPLDNNELFDRTTKKFVKKYDMAADIIPVPVAWLEVVGKFQLVSDSVRIHVANSFPRTFLFLRFVITYNILLLFNIYWILCLAEKPYVLNRVAARG